MIYNVHTIIYFSRSIKESQREVTTFNSKRELGVLYGSGIRGNQQPLSMKMAMCSILRRTTPDFRFMPLKIGYKWLRMDKCRSCPSSRTISDAKPTPHGSEELPEFDVPQPTTIKWSLQIEQLFYSPRVLLFQQQIPIEG